MGQFGRVNYIAGLRKNFMQKSISKLILAGCTGSKNQVRNRLKIQFVELDFYKLIFQLSSTDQQGVSSSAQGSFTNYIDKILPIIDHQIPLVDIWNGITLLLLNTI